MLNALYASAPWPFESDATAPFPNSGGNISPWLENILSVLGIFTQLNSDGSNSLFMFAKLSVYGYNLIHEKATLVQWDALTGDYIGRQDFSISSFFSGSLMVSRLGNLYRNIPFSVENAAGLSQVSITDISTQLGFYSAGDYGVTQFTNPALDENVDVLIDCPGSVMNVYQLSTKNLLYTLNMPDEVVSITLQNNNNAYVLCANRALLVMDYVKGKVLGAVKMQPSLLNANGDYTVEVGTSMCWLPTLGRLYVQETTPNNTDGSPSITAYGYSPTPVATRLTTPVPMQEPQTNKQIPVLVCLVDDFNFGMGGAVITSAVTGDGTLVGSSYTNGQGQAFVQVLCGDDEGTAAIDCSVTI